MSETPLVILECKEAFENDKLNCPARTGQRRRPESEHVDRVRCSGLVRRAFASDAAISAPQFRRRRSRDRLCPHPNQYHMFSRVLIHLSRTHLQPRAFRTRRYSSTSREL